MNTNIVKTHFEELFANHYRFRRVLEEARSEKRQGLEEEDEEWEAAEKEVKGAMKMDELGKRRKRLQDNSSPEKEEEVKNGWHPGSNGDGSGGGGGSGSTAIEDLSSDDEVIPGTEEIGRAHV